MVSLGVPGAGACGASAGATLTLEELALMDAPADRRRFFQGLSTMVEFHHFSHIQMEHVEHTLP